MTDFSVLEFFSNALVIAGVFLIIFGGVWWLIVVFTDRRRQRDLIVSIDQSMDRAEALLQDLKLLHGDPRAPKPQGILMHQGNGAEQEVPRGVMHVNLDDVPRWNCDTCGSDNLVATSQGFACYNCMKLIERGKE